MKFLPAFIVLFFSLHAVAASGGAAPYYVPPGQFNAAAQVVKLGANTTALFGNATGSFSYDGEAKSLGALRLAVDTTSIVSNNADNQSDVSNLLGVSQYPEIRYTALDNVTFADGKASIKGTLTIHGTSKPVTMDATINDIAKPSGSGGARWGEKEMLGLSLHGSFKRADFGMADDPNVPGLFGDTINLQMDMQATKQ